MVSDCVCLVAGKSEYLLKRKKEFWARKLINFHFPLPALVRPPIKQRLGGSDKCWLTAIPLVNFVTTLDIIWIRCHKGIWRLRKWNWVWEVTGVWSLWILSQCGSENHGKWKLQYFFSQTFFVLFMVFNIFEHADILHQFHPILQVSVSWKLLRYHTDKHSFILLSMLRFGNQMYGQNSHQLISFLNCSQHSIVCP